MKLDWFRVKLVLCQGGLEFRSGVGTARAKDKVKRG